MLGSGAVPRPTSFPVLTPPARGGKGDLEFSGRWSSALTRGDGSVGPAAAACGGAPDDQAEVLQGPRPRAHGQDVRELHHRASPAPGQVRHRGGRHRGGGNGRRRGRGRGTRCGSRGGRAWGEAAVLGCGDPGHHREALGRMVRGAGPVGGCGAAAHRDRAVGQPGARRGRLVGPGGHGRLRARRGGCGHRASGVVGTSRSTPPRRWPCRSSACTRPSPTPICASAGSPGAAFEVRTARPGKSIRANWDDGSTRLVIAFTARGQARSQVALTHERIPDAATADRLKPWWRERVADLKRVLEA